MNELQVYFLAARDLSIGISPTRGVAVVFDPGLIPAARFSLQLTPSEARNIAEVLVRKAGEAEALPLPH